MVAGTRSQMRLVKWDHKRLVERLDGAMAQRMNRAAAYVSTDVKKSMRGGGKPHVPSRPGDPPNVDTGALRRSIRHEVIVQRHRIRGFVLAETPYARALELGYPPGHLAPRPYLRPALARSKTAIVKILIGKPIDSHLSLADIKTAQELGIVSDTSFGGL